MHNKNWTSYIFCLIVSKVFPAPGLLNFSLLSRLAVMAQWEDLGRETSQRCRDVKLAKKGTMKA